MKDVIPFLVMLPIQRNQTSTIFCMQKLAGNPLFEETVSKGDGTVLLRVCHEPDRTDIFVIKESYVTYSNHL